MNARHPLPCDCDWHSDGPYPVTDSTPFLDADATDRIPGWAVPVPYTCSCGMRRAWSMARWITHRDDGEHELNLRDNREKAWLDGLMASAMRPDDPTIERAMDGDR